MTLDHSLVDHLNCSTYEYTEGLPHHIRDTRQKAMESSFEHSGHKHLKKKIPAKK